MRLIARTLSVATVAAALAVAVPAADGQLPPSPITRTSLCPTDGINFHVELSAYGDVAEISVNQDPTGTMRLAWVTHAERRLSRCDRAQPRGTAARTGLRPRVVVKTGWHMRELFRCPASGRLLVHVHALVSGLRQLSDPAPVVRALLQEDARLAPLRVDFGAELPFALAHLLRGLQARAASTPRLVRTAQERSHV